MEACQRQWNTCTLVGCVEASKLNDSSLLRFEVQFAVELAFLLEFENIPSLDPSLPQNLGWSSPFDVNELAWWIFWSFPFILMESLSDWFEPASWQIEIFDTRHFEHGRRSSHLIFFILHERQAVSALERFARRRARINNLESTGPLAVSKHDRLCCMLPNTLCLLYQNRLYWIELWWNRSVSLSPPEPLLRFDSFANLRSYTPYCTVFASFLASAGAETCAGWCDQYPESRRSTNSQRDVRPYLPRGTFTAWVASRIHQLHSTISRSSQRRMA